MPLKYSVILLFFFVEYVSNSLCTPIQKKITIMLDPAGDATHPGRSIDGTFERGITLQYAEQLKKMIELHNSHVRIIITRTPGETIEPLQNAQFANRLAADLFIHISCFHETEALPTLALYSFMWHPITDSWQQTTSSLSFIPYQYAHRSSLKKREPIISHFNKSISENAGNASFAYKGLCALPFKPLIGITQVAFGIELGLRSQHEWKLFLEPLCLTINNFIASISV